LENTLGLDLVDELQHLTLKFHQLGACLPEASIGFGTLLEAFKLFWAGRDVARPRTAAVGEDLGLV
jgi:hypothetical protein